MSSQPCLTQEQALAQAPKAVDGRFAVPQILEANECRDHPARRGHAGRQYRRQGGVGHRGDPGVPGSDRGYRRRLPRVSACGGGAGAGRGRAGSTRRSPLASRCRRRWPVCRWRSRTCSPRLICPPRRIEDPRGLDVAVRRHRHRAAAGGRYSDPGQDQYGRVRDGLVDRELRVRPDPQPVERRPGAGGIGRRQRGGACRVPGAAGHGLDTGGSIRQPAALTATVGSNRRTARCRGTA